MRPFRSGHQRSPKPIPVDAELSVAATRFMWTASLSHPNLIWIGAVASGASLLWVGAVGNLAVMAYSVVENTGRASGVMLTSIGVRFMIGPPVFGWSVDRMGAYDFGFALILAELITLTVLGFVWGGRAPASRGLPAATV